jgi:hypothetical protein
MALVRRETRSANTKLTSQAIWPIVKPHINRDRSRAPNAIHGLLGLKFHLVDKASAVADCIENHERRLETWVQALLEDVAPAPPQK